MAKYDVDKTVKELLDTNSVSKALSIVSSYVSRSESCRKRFWKTVHLKLKLVHLEQQILDVKKKIIEIEEQNDKK